MTNTVTSKARSTRLFFTAIVAIALCFIGLTVAAMPAYAVTETRVYTWGDGESQPTIPETITNDDGVVLTLVSTSTPTQATTTGTASQTFTRTTTTTCSESELANIQSIVASTYYVDDSGYTGNIPRTRIEYTPIYTTEEQTITTTATTITTSDTADAIPSSLQTTVYQGYSLSMTDVEFEDLGNGTYRATIYYSGTTSQQVFSHYSVTAYYSGTLTRTTTEGGSWSLTATYEGEDTTVTAENEEAGETEEIVEEEITEEEVVGEEIEEDLNLTNEEDEEDEDDGIASSRINNTQWTGDTNNEDTEVGTTIPWLLIIAGAGAAIVVIVVIIVVATRRGGKGQQNATEQQIVGYDENGNPIYIDNAAATVTGAAAAPAMPFIADDLEEPLECELIQVVGDGDDDQMPIAVLDVLPSIAEEIPTIITLPEVGEDDEFIPTEGADYYIALETVEPLVSNQMMIVSNDGQLIYDGVLVEQMRLETEPLVHALNRTVPEEMVNDVSDLVTAYELRTEELRAQRDAMKDEFLASQMSDEFSNYGGDAAAATYDEFATNGYSDFSDMPQADGDFGLANGYNDNATAGENTSVITPSEADGQVYNGAENFDEFSTEITFDEFDDDFPTK